MFFSFVSWNRLLKTAFARNNSVWIYYVCVWNITAPKKLDSFLLGFSVTVGEFNSDMQYYFTVMQAVLQ